MYFLRKIFFYFLSVEKTFSRIRNAIFPYDTRKIIFQCDFFGKTIFSEHLKKIYFHVIFSERSSFIFRLKNKIIFSGKRNTIFPDDTKNIKSQCDFFGKIIFSEHLEHLEHPVFRAAQKNQNQTQHCSRNKTQTSNKLSNFEILPMDKKKNR